MTFLNAAGEYLASDIRLMTPILLGALGLLLMNRCGLLNIGAEGTMLLAAFFAVLGSYYSGSVWVGLLLAMFIGMLTGLLFAFLTVTLRANQIIVGQAINLLGAGLSTTMLRLIFGTESGATPIIDTFRNIHIPGLSDLPCVGKAIFSQMPIVYIAFALVPILAFFLFRTQTGLNLCSVGENPRAAETLGVNVYRVRYRACIVGSMIIAMGGAYMSTGLMQFFTENMVASRGFIALAAIVFGRYQPKGVLLATLLFATGSVIANTLPSTNLEIPYNFVVMIPYVLTIVAMALFSGNSNQPLALGISYKKD